MTLVINRASTVSPPHTVEETRQYLDSILPQDPAANIAPPPPKPKWFPDPEKHPWERDHFLEQVLEDVTLNMAYENHDTLDKLSSRMIAKFCETHEAVDKAVHRNTTVELQLFGVDKPVVVPIRVIKEKAQAALIHLTS